MKGLKNSRKGKGFSQFTLAEFLHVSPSTVAQWELGEKNAAVGQVLSLCRLLDCLPSDLFLPSEKLYSAKNNIIPVFSGEKDICVSFVPLPENHPLSACHFGYVVTQYLSGRIGQGDVCYFELCGSYSKNDVVMSVDNNSRESLFIADRDGTSGNSTVAVCRFMQSRF